MAPSVAVQDCSFRKVPSKLDFPDGFFYEIFGHAFLLVCAKNYVGVDVSDLAQIVKSFTGADIGDVTGKRLKRSGDF